MRRLYFWTFITLVAIYLGLAVLLPSDPAVLERYNITQAQARFLSLSVALPVAAIYLSALYGFLGIRSYAKKIEKTAEGPSYQQLAAGLVVLGFSLPITSIASSLLNYVAINSPELLPSITIGRNYLRLFFPLIAFTLIARGSEGLVKSIKASRHSDRPLLSLLGIIVLSTVFTWLVVSRPEVTVKHADYYLPDWVVLTTLAVPYLFIWCRGLRAAYHLNKYRDKVAGKIYKYALGNLAQGTAAIIGVSILIQMISTVSARLIRLNLTPLLTILYVLIALYAVGFVLVARGAKKLKQIEEV